MSHETACAHRGAGGLAATTAAAQPGRWDRKAEFKAEKRAEKAEAHAYKEEAKAYRHEEHARAKAYQHWAKQERKARKHWAKRHWRHGYEHRY